MASTRADTHKLSVLVLGFATLHLGLMAPLIAQKPEVQTDRRKRPAAANELTFPPELPGGQSVRTDTSEQFLKPPATLRDGVDVARTPPTVDFLFYPGQNYPGQPWSNWGDGLAVNGKYYSSIGDHLAIGAKGSGEDGVGTAFVFEYDPDTKSVRKLVDVAKLLDLPAGRYTPGKIHTRLDLGRDGWLYYATHRGSERSTTDENHYRGDWILRTNPQTGVSEVIALGPVPNHAIPNGRLDPDRLIYYGGTAAGVNSDIEGIQFFAYDVKNRKLLYSGPDGPARYMILARSTGRLYYVPGADDGPLMRFDPASGEPPTKLANTHIGVRAATQETPDGFVYTVSKGQRSADATVWSFNTRTEEIKEIGTAAVGTQAYVASITADPLGRYLYYVPGAHGGSERDGTPVVQFDVRSGQKKVIAFLEPFYTETCGFTLKGTYSAAVDPAGDKLYITWNVSRGSRAWDCCGLTVVHIPESER
jgi:hypothetical protein